ncbi:hypothetical protein HDU79_008675 [Rhizoclosmatium sp. JEL0117]|nr:hypothetical protein HDU79_008675 [Rhizoclosmatium sp. JEL0117]
MRVTSQDISEFYGLVSNTSEPVARVALSANANGSSLGLVAVLMQCRVLVPSTPLRLNALAVAGCLATRAPQSPSPSPSPLRLRFVRLALVYLNDPLSFEPPVSLVERWLLALCCSFTENSLAFDLLPALHQKSADDLVALSKSPAYANQMQAEVSLAIQQDAAKWHEYLHMNGLSCIVVPRVFLLPCTDILDPAYSDVTLEDAITATMEIFDLETYEDQVALSEFDMPNMIPLPPILVPSMHQYIWESDEATAPDPILVQQQEDSKRLLELALERPLRQLEQTQLNTLIQQNPMFILEYGESNVPRTTIFASLVNTNPNIAIEVLKGLFQVSAADEFIDTLVQLPLSLQVMDVVNKLISSSETAHNLPDGFINLYIANICQQCVSGAGDKLNQARLVRLVSFTHISSALFSHTAKGVHIPSISASQQFASDNRRA